MEAQPARVTDSANDSALSAVRALAAAAAVSALVALFCLSALLCIRRAMGALISPLSPAALLIVASLLSGLFLACRLIAPRQALGRTNSLLTWLLTLLPLAAAALAFSALVNGSHPVWTITAAGLVLAAGEIGWWLSRIRRLGRSSGRQDRRRAMSQRESRRDDSHKSCVGAELPETAEQLSCDISQQVTRWRDDDGVECLLARLRGEFDKGQRTINLHVAFCPPLESVPALEVRQIDGPPARIKLAQVESFGARLDLKLVASSNEAVSVLVEVRARQRAESRAA